MTPPQSTPQPADTCREAIQIILDTPTEAFADIPQELISALRHRVERALAQEPPVGYLIVRKDGSTSVGSQPAAGDVNLPPGTYDLVLASHPPAAPQEPATSTGLEPAREAITEYERGYMAGVLVGGADGGRLARLLQMVLDDIGICRGELGSGYEFQELSSETVEALDTAYREAMKPRAPQPPAKA